MDISTVLSALPKDGGVMGLDMFTNVAMIIAVFVMVELVKICLSTLQKSVDKKTRMNDVFEREQKRERANNVLYDVLETARLDMEGDRIQVCEFSNGTQALSFLPYKHIDVTYEANRRDLAPISDKMSRVLTSLFGMFLTRLRDSSLVVLHLNDKDKEIPPSVYHFMDVRGSLNSLSSIIRNPSTKQAVGYVNLDRANDKPFSEDVGKKLKNLAVTIGTYITLYPEELTSNTKKN